MRFEDSVTSFHEALADLHVARVCHALDHMRLASTSSLPLPPTSDSNKDNAASLSVRDEIRRSCELKAHRLHDLSLVQLRHACTGPNVDVDEALAAFMHCVTLGAARDAATPFASCLHGLFTVQAQARLERVRSSRATAHVNEHGYIDRVFYVEALSELVTGATEIMNAVADVVQDTPVLRQVLEPIHASCAEMALQMVQLYAGDARMKAWERRAKAQAERDSREREAQVEADESLQMIDLFLDEVAFMIRVLVSYTTFLKTVCEDLGTQNAQCGFQMKVQELTGVYVVLERFYVFQSVQKATVIAEPQELEPGVYVSSVVEDVSFVLNKAFYRASQCMNYHTALSIVIALVDALESLYLPAILVLLSRPCVIPSSSAEAASVNSIDGDSTRSDDSTDNANGVSFSDALLQAVDEDLKQALQEEAKLLMTINSAYMSGKFVQALQEKIDEYSRTGFLHEASILDCLPTPIHDMTEAFHSIVSNEVQEVLSRSMCKRLLEVIRLSMNEQLKYVLTSAEYDAFGSRGSPLLRLVEREVMHNQELQRYKRALCSAPYEDLVEAVAKAITSCLECALLAVKKPCNELGALQLEREVTDILALLSTLVPQKSLRASFTRLFQVIFILNLMQPSHVVDYLARVREELSVDTIAILLQMRVDFQPEDVALAIDQLTKEVDVETKAELAPSLS
uniref:COG4 transport protein middle alpha-helical bundle domain-containing protein n=1 Tax=Peronospora matthiolae TaxID=2874970 RepID=A0AAV1T6T1_9STRA